MCFLRLMEILFFLYFFIHIFIGVFFDTQIIASDLNIPMDLYPAQVVEWTKQYVVQFKDPYFVNPPSWYRVFCFGEIFLQIPFCVIAAVAFLMGSQRWIRVPTIIYCTHTITTLAPIVYSVAVDDFSKMNRVGPATEEERMQLIAVYSPYVILPLLILITMLTSSTYSCGQLKAADAKASAAQKPSYQKKKQHNKKQQ